MQTYDIIGDIHGYAEELKSLLDKLGYKPDGNGGYTPPEPGRQVVFTGDFIDRGGENFEVIDIVRKMVEAGHARAIMGNHDLNAGLFHTSHPDAEGVAKPLRKHDAKNTHQHRAFLAEVEGDAAQGEKNIEWLKSLPVFLELEGLRFVHAMWHQPSIDHLRETGLIREDNTIAPERWHELAVKHTHGCDAIELLTKGMEIKLPVGVKFKDADGNTRNKARLKWWANPEKPGLMLHEVILDVPAEAIPNIPASDEIKAQMRGLQKLEGDTVFFGHYWRKGEFPTIETKNAICIDQSVAKDGHLAAATVTVNEGVIEDMSFTSVKSRPPATPARSAAL